MEEEKKVEARKKLSRFVPFQPLIYRAFVESLSPFFFTRFTYIFVSIVF